MSRAQSPMPPTARTDRAEYSSSFTATLAAVTMSLAVWWMTSRLLVPAIITAGYEGRAFSQLNALFDGRSSHPLTEYLADWQGLARQATWMFILLSAVLIALSIPVNQRLIDRLSPVPHTGNRATVELLSRWRKLQIGVLMTVMLGGHAVSVVLGAELWPFSNYSMYSSLQSDSFSMNQLVVVDSTGAEYVLDEETHFLPFGIRLPASLNNFRWPAPGDTVRLRRAVVAAGALYEKQRLNAIHDGPPLSRIRLYTWTWKLEPAPERGAKPESSTLVFDYAIDH